MEIKIAHDRKFADAASFGTLQDADRFLAEAQKNFDAADDVSKRD